MKLLTLTAAATVFGLAGCSSIAPHEHAHWTPYYDQVSLARAFLSYDAENDGNYRDFQYQKKKSINLIFRRYFFNENPDNPFEPVDPTWYEPRPNWSLTPRFWDYIHVEGLVLGLIPYSPGGVFVPIPVDSIIGTFDTGGDQEFMDGIGMTVKPIGVITTSFIYDGLGFPDNRKNPSID